MVGTSSSESGGTTETPTRVLVVDNHFMFAELLTMALRQECDLEVVEIALDGRAAVELATDHRPDVVVVVTRQSGDEGMIAAAQIGKAFPEIRLVMITPQTSQTMQRAAATMGCAGIVTKDREVRHVVAAVRSTQDASTTPSASAPVRVAAPRSAKQRFGGLTEREGDVLERLSRGATTREIADLMFISLNTARNHIQRVISKLGAHSRHEAVAIAFRIGLIGDRRSV